MKKNIFNLFVITFFLQVKFLFSVDIENLLNQMTLEEKIEQLYVTAYTDNIVNTRLTIPPFAMGDGPHGMNWTQGTSFPVGIAMAASWDPELIYRVGVAMGSEFRGADRNQLLGPCVDICRDPRNGRSPESGGEDPYLNAQITTGLVQGIQSVDCIATVKHFNLVNRQSNRHGSDATIDKRTLIEFYGLPFRNAVQKGNVWSVMNSYNLINGERSSESYELLTTILKEKWEFQYYVLSDWGEIDDAEKAIEAGTDGELVGTEFKDNLKNLVNSGRVSMAVLDEAVRRVLRTKDAAGMLDGTQQFIPESVINSADHRVLNRKAGTECIVLLKNDNNILPLKKDIGSVAVIGPNSDEAKMDGAGSSDITPAYKISTNWGIKQKIGSGKVHYEYGCDIWSSDTSGYTAAKNAAANADVVVFVGGLDKTMEGEQYAFAGNATQGDRQNGSVQLPTCQQDLINELAKVNSNIVVVLISGGICAVNHCIDNIDGFVYAFYNGNEQGNAITDVLFGDYNPSGKLPVTMPKTDEQMPPNRVNTPDMTDDVIGGVGYRWYDSEGIIPQYAFGHGLSYTTFQYSRITANVTGDKSATIHVDVTNTGSVPGTEVVQLYLSDPFCSVGMPVKQLKGFKKIYLDIGETKTVNIDLDYDELSYYDIDGGSFVVEGGTFTAHVGGASDNLPLSIDFVVNGGSVNSYTLRTSATNGTIYPASGNFTENQIVKLEAFGDIGYVFSEWSGDLSGSMNPTNITMDADKNITANFTPVPSYTLTTNATNGSIALYPPGGTYNEGTVVRLTAIPDLGYEFSGWSGDFSGSANPATIIMDANRSLTADFSLGDTFTAFAVNSGGSAFTSDDGTAYNADMNYSDGNTYSTGSSISGTGDDPLYQSERYGNSFSYDIPMPNGNYLVTLMFAEIYHNSARNRVFNVAIEDSQVISNLDIWTKMGKNAAYDETHAVTLSDEVLNISFSTVTDNAKISAIRVVQVTETSIEDKVVPQQTQLGQNYPNPFNPKTTIPYHLTEVSHVKLTIHNSLGRQVITLVDEQQAAGYHKLTWNGNETNGKPMASGIYIYRLETSNHSIQTKKFNLIK